MSAPLDHALLSPSSAARWLNCTPSARLTEGLPDTPSPHAAEGSMAHELGELYLRKHYTTAYGPKKFATALKKLKADPRYLPEMDRHIDTYVDFIAQVTNAFPAIPYVAVEQSLQLNTYAPESFGTCDCLVIGDRRLHIVDLKYGANPKNRVDAENNPQMMLYALGALDHYALLYQDIDTVAMSICQPRLNYIPTWDISVADLRAWGERMKPLAQLAWEGKGALQEGRWCTFCKASGRCPEQKRVFTSLEDFGLKQPALLSNEEVADALTRGQRLAAWLKKAEAYALSALLEGQDIPGWKAVTGRADRKFSDADAAFAAARLAGMEEAMLYKREPLSLAALEKVMGPKQFAAVLGSLVVVPPGTPTLAPASDKRQAINRATAQDDFKEA